MKKTTRRNAAGVAAGTIVVLATGIISGLAPTDGPPATAAPALRAHGLQLGYNLDRAEALAAFKEAAAADPDDPAAYRLAAATTWIELLFQQGAITVDDYLGQARTNLPRAAANTALDAAFHDAIHHALTTAEEQLRAHPSSADAHYQVGAAYGYLASYTATIEGRLLASLGPARRAYHEHERALALDPTRKDAGLVVGMYRYAVSGLPVPMRLLARLAGFGGDRQRALRMIEEAADYRSDVQPNALFTLVLIYNREARYDDALRMIGELQQRFPRNRLLWLEAGNTALRAGRLKDARASLEDGLARLSHDPRPQSPGENSRWRYAYGATLVGLHLQAAAGPELRAALAGATRDWVRGRTHKELGKLADLAADRRRALEEYRVAAALCRQDHDADCSDEVQQLMKVGYNGSKP